MGLRNKFKNVHTRDENRQKYGHAAGKRIMENGLETACAAKRKLIGVLAANV